MRAWLFGVTVVLAATSAALASDPMAGYFGNTIVAKTASSELHIHYRSDHTFDGEGTSSKGPIALHGTWTFDEKKGLCRSYDPPPAGAPNPMCTPWSAHQVGDTWSMPDVTLTLVRGIQ